MTGIRRREPAAALRCILLVLVALAAGGCASTGKSFGPPPSPGSYFHTTVQEGESVSSIAYCYRVSQADIVSFNRIHNPNLLHAGQSLRIPNGASRRADCRAKFTVAGRPSSNVKPASYAPPTAKPPRNSRPVPAAAVTDPNARFLWPVEGPVLSPYGKRATGEKNDGINIAVSRGTPIKAADSGTVIYAGNELKGYGNLVLIRHESGYVTTYAHADRLAVERGARVARGQTIAYAGSTGDVTQPQVHFEVRRGSQPVDPGPFLVASR